MSRSPRSVLSRVKVPAWIAGGYVVAEWAVKILALGAVPENRKPGSAAAWLLLVFFAPVVGVPAFLLLGSPYVRGRRERIQGEVNRRILERTSALPALPSQAAAVPGFASIVEQNRRLASMPAVSGRVVRLLPDSEESIRVMAAAVRRAQEEVSVQFYIFASDPTTEVFLAALEDAVKRGVRVRVLMDHLGSRGYPGFAGLKDRLDRAGIEWHLLMPIDPLHRRWRRPDLRNHRKLVVVDGTTGFMGSQNMIDSGYLKPKHQRAGRHWRDLNIELTGAIVDSLSAVFAIDWYTETGEEIPFQRHDITAAAPELDADESVMQLVPSGPGFTTEPNLRLFLALVHGAQRRLSITSPYFVPDDALLYAITSAAYRGVEVELFVSEQADQFMVHHAQRSYYRALLDAGVRIWLFPKPTVLHSKHITIDDEVGVIGSSNMDPRSFLLDYEITLLGHGRSLVAALREVEDGYRRASQELRIEDWHAEPRAARYLDNVMRLTSDLQ